MANWFYRNGEKSVGPIDEGTMRAWIKQGSIAPSQLVHAEGSDDWQRADHCFSDLMDSNKAPDLLAEIAKTYFECDGLCFMPVFDAVAGKCRISLFYQNRFKRDCRAQITLKHRPGFWPGQAVMKPLTIEVACAGGEFGVVRRLYAVPKDSQGKSTTFNVAGETTYPNGKGDMIRFRDGIQVLAPEDAAIGMFRILAALFAHIIVIRKDARFTYTLPKGVAEVVNEGRPPEQEILWSFQTT